jgi:HD-like signal output (HDOD) protein
VKVDDFCSCIFSDPVPCIELLKRANSMELGVTRVPITTLQNAVMRLGWNEVHAVLTDLIRQKQNHTPQRSRWIEIHRRRCKQAGMVARILAENFAHETVQSAHLCGLFLYLGDILAVIQMGSLYTDLADLNPRSRVNYRIATDYGFDTEEIGLDYLRGVGIPNALIDAIDRNTHQKELSRHMLRPIVFGAGELVEAHEAGKFDRYELLDEIPNNSQLRLFKSKEAQYNRIINHIKSYLEIDHNICNLNEEPNNKEDQTDDEIIDTKKVLPSLEEPPISITVDKDLKKRLDKLKSLIDQTATPQTKQPTPTPQPSSNTNTNIRAPKIDDDRFKLKEAMHIRQRKRAQKVIADHPTSVDSTDKSYSLQLQNASQSLSRARDTEQLSAMLLNLLTQYGFARTAIIVVSEERTDGIVIAARGDIKPGLIIKLDKTYSPIAQGVSKVQSTKDPSNNDAPFGSTTFAVAPLMADHQTPVYLYADCGHNKIINFETRRLFRGLVNIVNTIMPRLPGGLLLELSLNP